MAHLTRAVNDKAIGRLRLSARTKAMLMLAAVMAFGAALSVFNAPLASSAANSIEVLHSEEAVPMDPEAELWNRAKEVEIPLSSQQIYQPGGGSTRLVRVRAIEDGQAI